MIRYFPMKNKILITFFVLAWFCALPYFMPAPAAKPIPEISQPRPEHMEKISKDDRILIMAPHPDDESIACAGIIQEALRVGADLHVLYLTNGDHNEFAFIVYEKRITFKQGEFIHMGNIRQQEAIKAMEFLGLSKDNLIFLGYPDFGTFAIFRDYWNTVHSYKSVLTRVTNVPYKNDLSYGNAYIGENILQDIENILKRYRPNKIFVTHPADVNSDHKAFYLFLQIALADLKNELPNPEVYPYLVHWFNWPMPRHYHPELGLDPPQELMPSEIKWSRSGLNSEALEKKYKAILFYKSQTQSSAFYLLSFGRKNELFGDYPAIDAAAPEPLPEKSSAGDKKISWLNRLKIFLRIQPDKCAKENSADNPDCQNQLYPVSYRVKNGSLLITVNKSRDTLDRFNTLFYLFGYSEKTPFAKMPKIRVVAKRDKLWVFNGRHPLNPQNISFDLGEEAATLTIPLAYLGDPDFILASVRGMTGKPFIETGVFRKVILKGAKNAGTKSNKN